MTQAIYLNDSYLKEFEAEVVEVNGKFVFLNQTVFYPNSGGQPHDLGYFLFGNERFNVLHVCKSEGKISHEVDREGLKQGDKIKGVIDWERRYRLMRNHTAAHILSQVIHNETNAMITGNQLDLEQSRTDLSLENYIPEKMQEYISMANDIIQKDLKISFETVSRKDADMMPNLSKLAMGLPEGIKEIRIVKIGDFDMQADGGTHVKSTKEIGKILFLSCKNKGKDNRRLYFTIEP